MSRAPRFGLNNLYANAGFLSFLQYFGDEQLRKKNGFGISKHFFQSIIKDDPYYKDFYVFLTNSVSVYAAEPEASVSIMNRGLSSLAPGKPEDSYYIWRYKGVDELLFLGDSQAAKQSFQTAASWASESDLPDSQMIATISRQTASFLEQDEDSKVAQIGAWGCILTTAFDDETRNRAIRGIQELGGEAIIHQDGRIEIKYEQIEKGEGR